MNFLVQNKPIGGGWLPDWKYKFEFYNYSTKFRTFINTAGNKKSLFSPEMGDNYLNVGIVNDN